MELPGNIRTPRRTIFDKEDAMLGALQLKLAPLQIAVLGEIFLAGIVRPAETRSNQHRSRSREQIAREPGRSLK